MQMDYSTLGLIQRHYYRRTVSIFGMTTGWMELLENGPRCRRRRSAQLFMFFYGLDGAAGGLARIDPAAHRLHDHATFRAGSGPTAVRFTGLCANLCLAVTRSRGIDRDQSLSAGYT